MTQTAASTSESSVSPALSMDTITAILRKRWYWILLLALLGAAAAYYYAGRQNFIFEKTASVMMRESNKASSSDRIMVELGVESGAANLANESFILRSSTVMRQTVEDLHLNVSYWKKQDLREVDLYKDSPIVVSFDRIEAKRACSFEISLLPDKAFSLVYMSQDGLPVVEKGVLGVPLDLPFASITIHPTSHMPTSANGQVIFVRRVSVNSAADQLLSNFTVKRPDAKDSSLLQMTLTSTNPAKATDTLNALIEVYNNLSKDEKRATALKTKEFIKDQLQQIGSELQAVDVKMDDIKNKNELIANTDASMSADFSAAQALDTSIFELETQIKLADNLASNLDAIREKAGLISLDTGIADSGVARQIEAFNTAYLEYQKIAGSAGSQNPLVVALVNRMEATRTAASSSLTHLRNNLNMRRKELEKKRMEIAKRLGTTSKQARELTPLDREHRVREELYLTLLSKAQENELSLAITEPSARVLETAHGSNCPIAPNTQQFVMGGALGGAAVCFLSFLGLAMLNNKVKNKHDLPALTHLPVIAELPAMSKKEKKQTGLMLQNTQTVISEYFQILRHNVDSMIPASDQGGYVIVLTSTMPGEGKTFISANLAQAFANIEKKVLLIDGDLRKSSLSNQLGGKGRKGLSSLLLHKTADLVSVIQPVLGYPGLDILYTGPHVPNPVTLLSQQSLAALMAVLRKQYDVIVIDAPPYSILADTAILAEHADISLYVMFSNKVDKRYISNIEQFADSGSLPNLGFVINGVDFKAAKYHYYGSGYHYGYGAENVNS